MTTKNNKSYPWKCELPTDHAELIAQALDLYSRVKTGQLHTIIDLFDDCDKEKAGKLVKQLESVVAPNGKKPLGKCQDADRAYTMSSTIKNALGGQNEKVINYGKTDFSLMYNGDDYSHIISKVESLFKKTHPDACITLMFSESTTLHFLVNYVWSNKDIAKIEKLWNTKYRKSYELKISLH